MHRDSSVGTHSKTQSTKALKIAFGCISLAALTLGFAINWFAGETGLTREAANAAAFGMLLTAIAHALALGLWDSKAV